MDVVSRAVAAVIGGYALASATAVCLALILPMARSEAVLTGTMVSFVAYVCAVIWAFSAASAARAWTGLLLAAGALGISLLIHRFAAA